MCRSGTKPSSATSSRSRCASDAYPNASMREIVEGIRASAPDWRRSFFLHDGSLRDTSRHFHLKVKAPSATPCEASRNAAAADRPRPALPVTADAQPSRSWRDVMNVKVDPITELPTVEAELNYLAPMSERPRNYTYEPPPGTPRSNVVAEPHKVVIRDARPIASGLSLDREGFALVRQKSKVRDFYDDDEVRGVYYPEAEAAIKEATGADRVFIFDHTVRRRVPGAEDRRDGLRQPVARVHVDHTDRSGPQRVRDLIPDEAETLLQGRVQIINLWRPIRGPLRNSPLAVCDARTVSPDDLVASDLVYPQRTGETYQVLYDDAHRWFYVPDMLAEEALLLKCYNSASDGRARFAPHTAFTDPNTPQDAPPRESIEIRSLVFHRR